MAAVSLSQQDARSLHRSAWSRVGCRNTATNGPTTSRTSALTATSLAFNSGAAVTVNIYGPTNYTQIVANGPVNLGGATLQVNLLYNPLRSDVFYIVLNGSVAGVSGTFAGLPKGTPISLGHGYSGRISYTGTGDGTAGNDVKIYSVGKSSGTLFTVR